MTMKNWIGIVLVAAASLTGCAVDTEVSEDVQEPFEQVESSLTRRDTCMMGCGSKYARCKDAGGTLNECATDYGNCVNACDTSYPAPKVPIEPK